MHSIPASLCLLLITRVTPCSPSSRHTKLKMSAEPRSLMLSGETSVWLISVSKNPTNLVITVVFCIHFLDYDCRLCVDDYVNASFEMRGLMFFQLCSSLSASSPTSFPTLLLKPSGRFWMQVTALTVTDTTLSHQVTIYHVLHMPVPEPCTVSASIQQGSCTLVYWSCIPCFTFNMFLPYQLGITVWQRSRYDH